MRESATDTTRAPPTPRWTSVTGCPGRSPSFGEADPLRALHVGHAQDRGLPHGQVTHGPRLPWRHDADRTTHG